MPLTEYLRILRRWGWVLILTAALTAAAAYAVSKAQPKVYKATIFVSVNPQRPDLGTTQSAKSLLRNYVLRVYSETFAQSVIDRLQLDREAADLMGDVTIASDESRFAMQIDVEDRNPATANDIAREWAQAVVAWRETENAKVRIEDKVEANIVDRPSISLFRPKTSVNTLAGGILGLVLGALIVFSLEYVEADVIRSPEDVERVLGLSVLGAIPPAEPAGLGHRRRARR